jgi:hypothetical protein
MSKAVLVFFTGVGYARNATGNLLMLEKLRTADPSSMWRNLAEFRYDAESLCNRRRQGGYDGPL